MKQHLLVLLAMSAAASTSLAQGNSTADFRIKADFRNPNNGAWGANESVGNADFRIHSRFLAVYYGGVQRQDDFDFTVQIDFRDISGFSTQFAGSPYNTDFDVYIDDDFVGRVPMSASAPGLAELTYKSRHPTLPELPVPANWPSPIEVGSTVRVFAAGATLPSIGDPLPAAGTPIFTSALEERWDRGDANHDGHVDMQDFSILAGNFDPANVVGPHVGPTRGDFTGDNRADLSDYNLLVLNWDASGSAPSAPIACMSAPTGPANVAACRSQSAAFTVTAAGTGPFTYQWRKNGLASLLFTNTSARTATLTLSNVQAASTGAYDCVVTNACGSTTSGAATLTLLCTADFNCSRDVSVQDIFDFLAGYFSNDPRADVNVSGTISVQDIFDFLTAYFSGC